MIIIACLRCATPIYSSLDWPGCNNTLDNIFMVVYCAFFSFINISAGYMITSTRLIGLARFTCAGKLTSGLALLIYQWLARVLCKHFVRLKSTLYLRRANPGKRALSCLYAKFHWLISHVQLSFQTLSADVFRNWRIAEGTGWF